MGWKSVKLTLLEERLGQFLLKGDWKQVCGHMAAILAHRR